MTQLDINIYDEFNEFYDPHYVESQINNSYYSALNGRRFYNKKSYKPKTKNHCSRYQTKKERQKLKCKKSVLE